MFKSRPRAWSDVIATQHQLLTGNVHWLYIYIYYIYNYTDVIRFFEIYNCYVIEDVVEVISASGSCTKRNSYLLVRNRILAKQIYYQICLWRTYAQQRLLPHATLGNMAYRLMYLVNRTSCALLPRMIVHFQSWINWVSRNMHPAVGNLSSECCG